MKKMTVKYLTADATIHTLPVTTDRRCTTMSGKVWATARRAGLKHILRWELYEGTKIKLSGKPGGKLEEIDRVSKIAGLAHLDTPLIEGEKL